MKKTHKILLCLAAITDLAAAVGYFFAKVQRERYDEICESLHD